MFKRRSKRQVHHHLREAVWPTIGWRRSVDYIKHRVGRLPGTPYSIAAGFAWGAAVSCTPFMGLHIIASAIGAWITRSSVLAAALGTLVGNPWTFPLIWAWIYALGVWILGRDPIELNYENLNLTYLYDHFWAIFVPMMVGGVPTALVVWAAFFFPLRAMVSKYQLIRRARIAAKKNRAISEGGTGAAV